MFVYVYVQSFSKKCGSLRMALCVGQMLSDWKIGSKQLKKVTGKFSTYMEKCKKSSKIIFKKCIRKEMGWFCFLYTMFHFTCLVVVTLVFSTAPAEARGAHRPVVPHIFDSIPY